MDYLPRGEGNTKSFGGIEVTIKQIAKKADYTLTTLNIADKKVITSSSCSVVFRFPLFMQCDLIRFDVA